MKKSKLRKSSKNSTAQLKRKLDIEFSKAMRAKYAIFQFSGTPFKAFCYTCNKKFTLDKMHVSHFIPRSHHSTRWSEANVRLCCIACNVWKHGNLSEFSANLIKEIGLEEFNKLIEEGKKIKQWKKSELEEKINYYKKLNV